jgi:aspartokinase-like uncharacterized kinase
MRADIWVVKLGGSLQVRAELPRWLSAVARGGRGRAVIVPGGGAFADAVRHLHGFWGVPERTAHDMALAAMDQYGRLLAGLEPRLALADTPEALSGALGEGRVPVWLPYRMLSGDEVIECSWRMTADSLAAWLAGWLRARHLLLVKSAPLAAGEVGAATLAGRGAVDALFPAYLARSGARCAYLDATQYDLLERIMAARGPPPVTITSGPQRHATAAGIGGE